MWTLWLLTALGKWYDLSLIGCLPRGHCDVMATCVDEECGRWWCLRLALNAENTTSDHTCETWRRTRQTCQSTKPRHPHNSCMTETGSGGDSADEDYSTELLLGFHGRLQALHTQLIRWGHDRRILSLMTMLQYSLVPPHHHLSNIG